MVWPRRAETNTIAAMIHLGSIAAFSLAVFPLLLWGCPAEPPSTEAPSTEAPPATAVAKPVVAKTSTAPIPRVPPANAQPVEVAGCSDGTREGFTGIGRFPWIAGCQGEWDGLADLRAERTGAKCGNDDGTCASPADLCSEGWAICGSDGQLDSLRDLTADDCEKAGTGRFSAAVSHCTTREGCSYAPTDGKFPCFDTGWCSEPICCGEQCDQLGKCTDALWPGRTRIPKGMDQGCAAMSSDRSAGVLCCREEG